MKLVIQNKLYYHVSLKLLKLNVLHIHYLNISFQTNEGPILRYICKVRTFDLIAVAPCVDVV